MRKAATSESVAITKKSRDRGIILLSRSGESTSASAIVISRVSYMNMLLLYIWCFLHWVFTTRIRKLCNVCIKQLVVMKCSVVCWRCQQLLRELTEVFYALLMKTLVPGRKGLVTSSTLLGLRRTLARHAIFLKERLRLASHRHAIIFSMERYSRPVVTRTQCMVKNVADIIWVIMVIQKLQANRSAWCPLIVTVLVEPHCFKIQKFLAVTRSFGHEF